MGRAIRRVFKLDTIFLSETTEGYYLYDYVIGQNISMRAKTEQDACIEAILWYQSRLIESKEKFKILKDKVEGFLAQFDEEDL